MSAIYVPNNEATIEEIQPVMTEKTASFLSKVLFCMVAIFTTLTLTTLIFFNEDNVSKCIAITIIGTIAIYIFGQIVVILFTTTLKFIKKSYGFLCKVKNLEIRLLVIVICIIVLGIATNIYAGLNESMRIIDLVAIVILYLIVMIIMISNLVTCFNDVKNEVDVSSVKIDIENINV
jgi:hypothetical protein